MLVFYREDTYHQNLDAVERAVGTRHWKVKLQKKKRFHSESLLFCICFTNFNLCKLCEIFDGSNHLAGIRVFVVVPRNNLNLIGIIVNFCYHSLCCVKQAAVTHTDNVRRNNLIFCVAKAFALSCFHCSINAVFGNVLAFNNSNQNSSGAGWNRYTLSRTNQFAVQFCAPARARRRSPLRCGPSKII